MALLFYPAFYTGSLSLKKKKKIYVTCIFLCLYATEPIHGSSMKPVPFFLWLLALVSLQSQGYSLPALNSSS